MMGVVQMKKIYFVLTFTGTWLSRIVRVYTRKQYAHVSLALDKDLKYKVYLSPFISLNVDRHNYVSSTDLRLMRRIVRDNRMRATDVGQTISYFIEVVWRDL